MEPPPSPEYTPLSPNCSPSSSEYPPFILPSSPTESGSVVEVINVSSDEAEEKAATRDVPVKDGKPPASPVQDEVD